MTYEQEVKSILDNMLKIEKRFDTALIVLSSLFVAFFALV